MKKIDFSYPLLVKAKDLIINKAKIFFLEYKKNILIEHSVDKIKKHISKILIVSKSLKQKKTKKAFFKDKNIKIVTQKKKPEMASAISLHLIILKQNFFVILWAHQLGMTFQRYKKL